MELGATLRLANANYALGMALAQAGQADDALARLRQALTTFRDKRQRLWEGMTLFRLAEAHLALADPAQAAPFAEQALATLRDIGGGWRRAQVLTVLGRALSGIGQAGRARACWEQALAVFEKLGSKDSVEVRNLLASLTV